MATNIQSFYGNLLPSFYNVTACSKFKVVYSNQIPGWKFIICGLWSAKDMHSYMSLCRLLTRWINPESAKKINAYLSPFNLDLILRFINKKPSRNIVTTVGKVRKLSRCKMLIICYENVYLCTGCVFMLHVDHSFDRLRASTMRGTLSGIIWLGLLSSVWLPFTKGGEYYSNFFSFPLGS